MENKLKCANCQHKLDVGVDAIKVDAGVIGTRGGFVPLDEILYFCCDSCISEYYDLSDLPSMPKRMP